MIIKFTTHCIRFCETKVLGDTHKWVLEKEYLWNGISTGEDEIKAYTIEALYDVTRNVGFLVLALKIYKTDGNTQVVEESIYPLDEKGFYRMEQEYIKFKK